MFSREFKANLEKLANRSLNRTSVNGKARKLTVVLTVTTNDYDLTPGILGNVLQQALESAGFGVAQLAVKETGELPAVPVEDFIDNDEGRE